MAHERAGGQPTEEAREEEASSVAFIAPRNGGRDEATRRRDGCDSHQQRDELRWSQRSHMTSGPSLAIGRSADPITVVAGRGFSVINRDQSEKG
ncbi:hypothetical protein H7J93_13955 [Mycobacterium barrassiae]|uniref:hypothetical protein n=1 Tax=Mycobacterium barrassiae TaxID=319709 RepID=UPI00226594BE|nr:hypothetical protein [Mycobacterium barrassiae]MCV7300734.1 hypothetical protein [Mycobacterium barrassiae]